MATQVASTSPGSRVVSTSDNTVVGQVVLNPDGSNIGGGGSGGNATIVAPLGTQTVAASVATAINGFPASGTTTPFGFVQLATGSGSGTVTAGKIKAVFFCSSDFKGSINGVTIDNTTTNSFGTIGGSPDITKPFAAISWTVTAGTLSLQAF